MASKLGVIGGSGVYKMDNMEVLKEHTIMTPYGETSSAVLEIGFENRSFYFLPRHGKGHFIQPSDINYCANIYALKKLGVHTTVSISAVGSLKENLDPTTIFLPDQFIDWTKGLRRRTFFGEGIVGHVSAAYPIEKNLKDRLEKACREAQVNFQKDGSYLCIEGPQFSTRAESNMYRQFGASVIGMTNVPEAFLAKEAGMAYATLALVTDYDCWKEEHCSVEEIMKVMGENYKSTQKILKYLVPDLIDNPVEYSPENKNAVVTNPDQHPQKYQEILDVLLN